MPALPFLLRMLSVSRTPGGSLAGVRPGTRRKAPRALVWGTAIFVGTQLALGVASELYPRIRDPLYGDKKVKLARRLPDDGPRPTTIVMLGSSRTGLAFHGKRVEERFAADLGRPAVAFNMGVPASGPVTHLVYLNRLIDDGITPDFVLVEVLPSMIADRADAPLEKHWLFADRLRYGEQDTVIRHGFDAPSVRDRWWRSVVLPVHTLRFQLLSRVAQSWLPWQARFDWSRGTDECGWGTSAVQQATADDRALGLARASAEYGPILADLHPGGPAVGALRELVQRCQGLNIPVRLVLMPEGSAFRALYSPAVNERLKRFLADFTAELGIAPTVDARTWLDDEMFWDSHHMLIRGAEAFSERLASEAIVPEFRDAAVKRR